MKKKLKQLIGCFLLMLLVVTVIPAIPSEASAKSAALSKYSQLLRKSRLSVLPQGKEVWYDYDYTVTYYSSKASDVKFSIAYIDGDDVPDLVLQDRKYGYGVWTYKNGSFRCLRWDDCYSEPVGYYKKKGIFRENSYTEGSPFNRIYYKLQTGKNPAEIQYQQCNNGEYRVENWGFYVGRKRVSSSAFYKNLKKYVGNTKMTRIYMHNNIWANRNKYLR
ncbi:MAG: hypothetical protein E7239_06970 [Sarcina sp.]|nr:hypothetical protein [Sarcina sp.]